MTARSAERPGAGSLDQSERQNPGRAKPGRICLETAGRRPSRRVSSVTAPPKQAPKTRAGEVSLPPSRRPPRHLPHQREAKGREQLAGKA
nr:MAG TPA_asm: hypothetical protein [Caudoviricetes sp.]